MRLTSIALLLTALIASPPAAADYREFTGTIRIRDASPGGSARFLPEGVGVSGSGIAWSQNGPIHRGIRNFAGIQGFIGSLTTAFGSTGGYTQMLFVSGFGPGSPAMSYCWASVHKGCFTTNTVGQFFLHGRMPVRGLAERSVNGNRTAAFRLTTAGDTGLGLGGTLPALSGSESSVRFGATWRTDKVSVMNVIVESHPVGVPVYANITGMGFDTRTTMGMGMVQFVTPVRTVTQPPVCPLPPCAPILGKRGAVVELTLNFAPEPARGLLLLAACGALALLGASRRARR